MDKNKQEYRSVCLCGWKGTCQFEASCPECGRKTEPDDDYQEKDDQ